MNNDDSFWKIRSEKYDELKWVTNLEYLSLIKEACWAQKYHTILDLGTGTGVVARYLAEYCDNVFGCDFSESMLKKGIFTGVSVVKSNATSTPFKDEYFSTVVSRMMFHHLLGWDFEAGLEECYRILCDAGTLVIAESIPPSEDKDVVKFFGEVRKYKEERRVLTPLILYKSLKDIGFEDIEQKTFKMDRSSCSTKNWLESSGLSKKNEKIIWDMHVNASDKIKEAYNMVFTKDDIILTNVNLIISGVKYVS